MKTKSKFLAYLTFLAFLTLFVISPSYAAQMEDYCVIPPYVKRDVSVNIMILMDNSNDMKDSAYGHDSDTDWDDSRYTPNATYDNYYGYFDPRGCYVPPITTNFKRVGAVDYTIYPETGCPPPGSGFNTYGKKLFNGNILNWALMSRLSVMKKVIMGGKFEPRPNDPQRIVFEGSDWVAGSIGCKWTITGGSTLTISDKGVPEPCTRYEKGSWSNIKMDITSENTRGVFQEFTDNYTKMTNSPPPDYNFDKNSPRFGLTDFGTGGTAVIDKKIPQDNPMNDYFTAVQNVVNREQHPLATAHKAIIDYFDEESPTTGTDPYKSCVSYESPCISPAPCRKSFILMITSGGDVTGNTVASLPSECSSSETRPLVKNACYAYNTDLRTPADNSLPGKQNLSTYAVQTFGTPTGLITSCDTLTGNAKVLCDAAVAGGGQYYQAGINDLDRILRNALQDIIKRAAAGTAASVLASGEGSGANLIQAVFYPRKKFGNAEIAWIGRLTNFWYYVDPYFTNSNIREDTTHDYILNLTNDYITQLYYDSTAEATKAKRWQDTDGDGDADTAITPDIEFENLTSLWEAGKLLWSRDPSTRTIKTTVGSGLIDFSTANASTYLQAGSDNEASQIISYVKGYDKFCSISITTPCTQDSGCPSGETCVQTFRNRTVTISGSSGVWKLGDVLNSTPKIASWLPLNTYNKVYGDGTYGLPGTDAALGDPADPTHFLTTSNYKSRGMVFAGANDGMLHAFKLGTLELKWTGQGTSKARLINPDTNATCQETDTNPCGKELWAFIPKNALPYLKYTADTGYCHIYSVDLTPYIFDASISGNPDDPKTVNSWRTILIGGMRYGGACRNLGSTCTDCVKTPIDGVGYSSYFALDITDQNNPQLLWEFSNENLGFTTTGPAVVRINATGDPTGKNKNGHWFVVFGSGPTGPTTGSGSTDYQFLGRSDQELKLFVIGPLSATPGLPTVTPISTGIPNAFAGSMLNSTHDVDLDYQDDAIYIPYVKKDTAAGTWTQGGVGRLLTKEDISPSNWAWSKVIDDIGPVTSSVVKLQNNKTHTLWLFFGTGRYYFEQAATVDDQDGQRRLFGITEPCFQNGAFSTGCTSSRTIGQLTQVDLTSASGVSDPEGWYINLDTSSGSYRAERVITDPMATSSGLVFFTTYKPYIDVCSFGGKSFIWALRYNTGGCASASLKGVALLQVSTGSIEQVNLSTAFTEKGGRRTSAMEGVPPTAQGLSLLSQPPPVKRTIHMRER